MIETRIGALEVAEAMAAGDLELANASGDPQAIRTAKENVVIIGEMLHQARALARL